ncbi:hypothetical protein WJX84_009432 [Apatococcus fuscideae]|uniref:Uncharacterized protein n=1 Tax=Apatococcus fuscideae TaxID=2026836 RepID=A0AAW1T9I0_9CHLO
MTMQEAHCERLAGSLPWRKVFWSQWGCLHVLHCSRCGTHFQARHLNQCWWHPDPIQFSSTGPGHYECCGRLALGARGAQGQDGCCSKEHCVDTSDPLVQVLLVHRHLIVEPSPQPEGEGRWRPHLKPHTAPSDDEQDESQMSEDQETEQEGDAPEEHGRLEGQEANGAEEDWDIADEPSISPSKLLLRDSPSGDGQRKPAQLAGLRDLRADHPNPFLDRALRLQLVREGDELQMNSLIGYLNQIRAGHSKQALKEPQRASIGKPLTSSS